MLLRGTILNRTYGTHENLHILLFLPSICSTYLVLLTVVPRNSSGSSSGSDDSSTALVCIVGAAAVYCSSNSSINSSCCCINSSGCNTASLLVITYKQCRVRVRSSIRSTDLVCIVGAATAVYSSSNT